MNKTLPARSCGMVPVVFRSRFPRAGALVTGIAMLLFALPATVLAHAYGAGGVDQYIRILPKADCIQVELDMHFAEVPAAAMIAGIDTNADGILSTNELYAYLEKVTPAYLKYLAMFHGEGSTVLDQIALSRPNNQVKERAFDLEVPAEGIQKTCTIYSPLGEKGQPTLRIRWLFEAKWPAACRPTEQPVTVRFRTAFVPLDCSRRIVYAAPEAPLVILESDVPVDKDFPRPPDITPVIKDKSKIPMFNSARLVIGPKPHAPASAPARSSATATPLPGTHASAQASSSAMTQTVAAVSSNQPPVMPPESAPQSRLLQGDSWLKGKVLGLLRPPLSPFTWPLAILLSLIWGAMHALAPGHGKTIAGVYLAGASASFRHALILGLATTLSHTAVVFVLAIVGYAMQGAMPYPSWLEKVGAAIILIVGLKQIRVGLIGLLGAAHAHSHADGHAHEHSHEHAHADGHEHGHEHAHADGHGHAHPHPHAAEHGHAHGGFFGHTHAPLTLESGKSQRSVFNLAVIGLSGGMVPCPAAIILLLLSWQLRVPGLGITCLLSFSLGLAGTLVGVGLLTILGKNLILRLLDRDGRRQASQALTAWLPILGGLLLLAMGLVVLLTT